MARQKKQVKIEEEKVLEKDKSADLSNTITQSSLNAISYKGTVKVRYIDKNGKIHNRTKHNSGKLGLFSCLCRNLAGLDTSVYKPSCIQGIKVSDDKDAFAQDVPFTSTPSLYKYVTTRSSNRWEENKEACSKIQYVFLIPKAQLTSYSDYIYKLKLLNNFSTTESDQEKRLCAEITLDGDSRIPMNLDSNLLIYWELEFINTENTVSA